MRPAFFSFPFCQHCMYNPSISRWKIGIPESTRFSPSTQCIMSSGCDSALKSVFLIVFALIIHHIALTPPNPPPKSATRQYVGWVDRTLCRSMCFPTVFQKVNRLRSYVWNLQLIFSYGDLLEQIVIWIVGITEIVGILSGLDMLPVLFAYAWWSSAGAYSN